MATDNTALTSPFEIDTHWGRMEPGEFARYIGAGDPNEIHASEPAGHEELGE